jgi:uncharacterized peroxidase-related enzyme
MTTSSAALAVIDGRVLDALNARRPAFVEGIETCRDAVLFPEEDLGLSSDLRAALGRRVVATAENVLLLKTYPAPGTADLKALASGEMPTDPALAALARHADMIAREPATSGPQHLQSLQDTGYSVPQIIALSELLAYACYQIRVVHGLNLLAGKTDVLEQVEPGSSETDGIPQISLKPLTWTPYLPPVEIADATPRQLEAMKVTPSAKKVSPYVRTLAHDPDSYVARTVLFNAIMYADGGLNRADRELGALGASLVNGCQYCANVHARQHARLSGTATTSALFAGRRDALSLRDGTIMDFAEALTATPPLADISHIQRLKRVGLDDAEIQDLVHSIAIFGWANRLMHPLGHSS